MIASTLERVDIASQEQQSFPRPPPERDGVSRALRAPPRPVHLRALILSGIYGGLAALLLSNAPLCPVASIMHHPCPGCGLTRATFAAAHFDFAHAWAMHPFAFALSPLLFAAAMFASVSYLKDGDARLPSWFRPVFLRGGLVLILLMVPFWIARFYGLHGGPVPTP